MCEPDKYLEGSYNEYMNILANKALLVVKGVLSRTNGSISLLSSRTLLKGSNHTIQHNEENP